MIAKYDLDHAHSDGVAFSFMTCDENLAPVYLLSSGTRRQGGADIPVCPRRLKARATL